MSANGSGPVLPWKKIWAKFDKWYSDREDMGHCSKCEHSLSDPPEWDEQKSKIERLVLAALAAEGREP